MKSILSTKMTDLLTKELSYTEFVLNLLENEMKMYEKKYNMKWRDFVDKFEKGELGDEKIWFTWYGLALSAKDWDETQYEIKKTIRVA
jgi:hypothetical protein